MTPKLTYTQDMDISCKEPEVTGACTAGLSSVFVPVQVLLPVGIMKTVPGCQSVPTLVSVTDTFCLLPSINLNFESSRLTALSLLTKENTTLGGSKVN